MRNTRKSGQILRSKKRPHPTVRSGRGSRTNSNSSYRIQARVIEADSPSVVVYGGADMPLIPNPIDQNPWAHWRSPMDMMRQGWSTSLFHAAQQWSTRSVVGFEDAVGEPVVTHELPDVLDRVELWALRRQQNDG